MSKCYLCPRKCGADRPSSRGVCGADTLRVALAAPHYCEEPCLSGTNGAGTVFFSGCPLSCVFCQNHELSSENKGKEISVVRLAEIFSELQNKGCHNIDLVSPTPYTDEIIAALDIAKPEIPVVWNTSGYERVETLKKLEGRVSVYLPDFKYVTPDLAFKYSGAANYPEIAACALGEMLQHQPKRVYENGLMKKGVIVRHLVLPSHRAESIAVLDFLHKNFDIGKFTLSLLAQYTPMYKAAEYKEINRTLTKFEYNSVAAHAEELGFECYYQDIASADEKYTPTFDFSGV
jgi:putative pyruvate formate lyase activating enzyme